MPYTELPPPPTYNDRGSHHGDRLGMTFPLLSSESTANDNPQHQMPLQDSSNHSNANDNHTALHVRNRGSSSTFTSAGGRILDRDADFFQSRGRWSGVELLPRGRRNRSSLQSSIFHPSRRRLHCCKNGAVKRRFHRWMPHDWFHTLAYQRTLVLLCILFVTYAAIVMAFGFVYLTVSIKGATRTEQPDGSFVTTSFCDMDINDHMDALYFSLSTMTTIGYGVSDYYFGGCWTPLVLVLLQVCTAITFDACAVGLIFTRMSRGQKRSKSIVVSNQAVVQVVKGTPYFMLRVGELRHFPLIDASVRLYCIRHERIPRVYPTHFLSLSSPADAPTTSSLRLQQGKANHPSTSTANMIPVETTHFVTRAMKLLHPDESLMHSNYILMSLPQVIVHRMDDTSPLVPPAEWYDAQGRQHLFPPPNPENWHDVNQKAIHDFWHDRNLEIVVLVEGTDELTGAAIQTRHSYCAGAAAATSSRSSSHDEGDVVWNRAFVNCILPYHPDHDNDFDDDDVDHSARFQHHHPICTVDFSLFHETVPTPRDCLASPYVPY